MPILQRIPASIECAESAIKARKVLPHLPIKNPYRVRFKNNTLIFPYKLDLNCEAHILTELDPKEPVVSKQSMLDCGDGIKGDMISGASLSPIKRDDAEVKRGSSTHKASYINLKVFLYAKLEKEFRSLENMKPKLLSQ